MILFFVLIVVLLTGMTTAAMMGKIGGFMADPTTSQSFTGLPDGSLSADALARVHFDQALRGYRMDQVDEVIDGLSERLRELETQLAAVPDIQVAARPDTDAGPPAPGGNFDAPAGSDSSGVPPASDPPDVDADPDES